MGAEPGDFIRTTFTEDGEIGLVLEVLDPADHWCRGLGRYPDHVFRVLAGGEIHIWDFHEHVNGDPEFEVIR